MASPLRVTNRASDCRRVALRAVPEAVPRIFAAVNDGKQWQTRDVGRSRGQRPNGTYLLGRARNEWATLLLSTDSSRNEAHPLRLHRICANVESVGPPS